MSKKSIILTVAGICCGFIMGINGCTLYEKLADDNHQTYTDMLDFYIYRDGDIKAASGVNRTYWSNKLADGYIYEK